MSNILFPAQLKYLEDFKSEQDTLILEMELFAKEHNVPILDWQSSVFMEQLVDIINPKRVLEIGTAIGYSSIRLARSLRKKGIVHTIELSEDNIKIAEDFISKAGLADKINILKGDALNIMPQLNKKYDFIFLDADKEDYKRLFDYSLVLLKKGGVLFVDNLLWHGNTALKKVPAEYKSSTEHIREFNKLFMLQHNLKTTILPIGDGIGLGIKN